jgi:hypothetical protein
MSKRQRTDAVAVSPMMRVPETVLAFEILSWLSLADLCRAFPRTCRLANTATATARKKIQSFHLTYATTTGTAEQRRWIVPPPSQCAGWRLLRLTTTVMDFQCAFDKEAWASIQAMIQASAPVLQELDLRGVSVPFARIGFEWPALPHLTRLETSNPSPGVMIFGGQRKSAFELLSTKLPALRQLSCHTSLLVHAPEPLALGLASLRDLRIRYTGLIARCPIAWAFERAPPSLESLACHLWTDGMPTSMFPSIAASIQQALAQRPALHTLQFRHEDGDYKDGMGAWSLRRTGLCSMAHLEIGSSSEGDTDAWWAWLPSVTCLHLRSTTCVRIDVAIRNFNRIAPKELCIPVTLFDGFWSSCLTSVMTLHLLGQSFTPPRKSHVSRRTFWTIKDMPSLVTLIADDVRMNYEEAAPTLPPTLTRFEIKSWSVKPSFDHASTRTRCLELWAKTIKPDILHFTSPTSQSCRCCTPDVFW